MEYLSEDATYLAGALAILGLIFLVMLRVSQQGKFLVWGLSTLGLAALVVAVEFFWVTDNERIEKVIYDLGRAVEASDAKTALSYMTDDVQYSMSGTPFSTETTKAMIEQAVSNARFDFLRISQIEASAMPQSRRGKAEFKVLAGGTFHGLGSLGSGAGTGSSRWSLGFHETSPGVWKVSRITPLQFPGGLAYTPTMGGNAPPASDRTQGQNRRMTPNAPRYSASGGSGLSPASRKSPR